MSKNGWILFIGLAVLLVFYLPLTQRIPNGADHYFMVDVGETQVVLNTWGTLHATGYPHYVITGSALTGLLRLFGAGPLLATALVSTLWGLLAAALFYGLMRHLQRSAVPVPLLVMVAYGLTLTVWVHQVIAEIYTFGMVIVHALFLIALWRGETRGWYHSRRARIYWLALLGGFGVAHHRAVIMLAPALLYAVWDEFTEEPRKIPLVILKSLGLGLVGFLPYLYLPIRDWQGAEWVYENPGSWAGFWAQFNGAEAGQYIGLPQTWADLGANLALLNGVLLTDLTLAGIVLGLAGLVWGAIQWQTRRPAITMILAAAVCYGFHALYYTDVLSALILPVTLALAFGWFLLFDELARAVTRPWFAFAAAAAVTVVFGVVMFRQNAPFISELVNDPRGLETIAAAEPLPDGSVVMLPWGPRHTALGYAISVSGELDGLRVVNHKADYTEPFTSGNLIAPEYLQHAYPRDWWRSQLGRDFYAQAAAPGMVRLAPNPLHAEDIPLYFDIVATQEEITCTDDALQLEIIWLAPATAKTDVSVFVHLLDENGAVIAQDDRFAPVYGWRPASTWEPGEIIPDVYTLPRLPDGVQIRFGMYHQDASGGFVNNFERELAVDCGA